jgi:hypothetical protein
MGTKTPPPMMPKAESRKLTTVATTTRQLNTRSYGESSMGLGHLEQNSGGVEAHEQRERATYGLDARRARGQAREEAPIGRRGGGDLVARIGRRGTFRGCRGQRPEQSVATRLWGKPEAVLIFWGKQRGVRALEIMIEMFFHLLVTITGKYL